MSLFPNEMPGLSGTAKRRGLTNAIGFLDYLDKQRSTRRILLCLLPAFLLLMWPTAFTANEYTYFMQPFRRVAPEQFSEFSAIFDSSSGRIVWEYLIGYPIAWFGYDATHTVARFVMAGGYAVSIAFLFNVLRLSALDGLLVVGTFVIAGQDILGKEWLFQGVESKTVAYALVIAGSAFAMRGRMTLAMFATVLATYLHFLVGGFWFLALLAYDAMRDFVPRRHIRHLVWYVLLVGPLAAVVLYQQLVSLDVPVQDPSASYLYSILRHPHHVAPFSSNEQLGRWLPDIALLVVMTVSFLYLAKSDHAKARPMLPWVAGLLCYLLVALGLSALDWKTGSLGKFHLFRPSSLILFFAIAGLVDLAKKREEGAGPKKHLRAAALFLVVPLAALSVMSTKVSSASAWRSALTDQIRQANTFVRDTSAPDEIVLVEPGDEYNFPLVALPMLLDRPTLVSFKFIPTNDREIYRWYDLLHYRRAVFAEGCKGIDRFPVRYLLMVRRPGLTPPCGAVVWESDTFALVDPTAEAD